MLSCFGFDDHEHKMKMIQLNHETYLAKIKLQNTIQKIKDDKINRRIRHLEIQNKNLKRLKK